ncbi:MAG: hypothetical protein QXL86_03850 [Candidatus Aenigmatarchaeota archaeon]
MGKGQTIVIQFLLFFLIGFSIFISLGSFFKYQSDLFRQEVLASGINLTRTYISSAIIAMFDSCKECDFVSLSLEVYNTSAGYPLIITTQNSMLNVSSVPMSSATSVHNLLGYPLTIRGSSSSAKPIVLTFNRTNNILEVS